MSNSQPPKLTDEEVVELVRKAACQLGFSIHPRCQDSVQDNGYDLNRVRALLAGCSTEELVKHELDYDYPKRQCYIVELEILDYDQRYPFYVKVSLRLPDLKDGYLLSFWPNYDRPSY